MRILMLTDFYPPVIGGLERQVQALSRELARRGHQVSVATMAIPGAPSFESDGPIRIHRLAGWSRVLRRFYQDPGRPFHPTVPDPGIMTALRRLVQDEGPDIVHSHSWILYSYLPAARDRPRLIVTLHDYGLLCAKKTFIYRGGNCSGPAYAKCVSCAAGQYGPAKSFALTSGLRAMRPLHRRVHRYLAVSAAVARASAGWTGRPARSVDVVPNFVPEAAAAEALRKPRPACVPAEGDYILFVGAIGPHKGIDVLLDAYLGVEDPPPLVVLGTPHADEPRSFPPNVHVAHDVAHSDVMAAWRHCLFGVVPSVWAEPFGLVAVECMASGRAVIASAVGGLGEVVQNGKSGILVPPGDSSALRGAIRRLLKDPELRARLGAGARARASRFTASGAAEATERLYLETLK
jgi:glycosyltransferase involved in cell wall biosynthesis